MSDQIEPGVGDADTQGTDWKAEARKWEQRAKDNKASLDTAISERDSVSARISQLESTNTELSGKVTAFESAQAHAALVAKVSEATGVDPKVLRGSTEDELTEHANSLKALFDSQPSAPVIPSQGKSPDNVQDDPLRVLARSLFNDKE